MLDLARKHPRDEVLQNWVEQRKKALGRGIQRTNSWKGEREG
tara:strand:- start:509 stop:634 length:126 start_codon:yes stop_codon:yes gene_type:complete